ncbi:transcription factor bHLH112-like isoform X2 [Senna tora]|uniref:Transcription factor bHLH112-like isoform X2 n=1 Tax=Senna tora TaxID=362788 RepID=A0A834SHQ6_9FABA|nr:transcription factor bHLH112-like isoform X2 [Senna tora]
MADEFSGAIIDGSWWNIYNSSKSLLFPPPNNNNELAGNFIADWKIHDQEEEEGGNDDVSDHHHHQQLGKPKQSHQNPIVYGSHGSTFHSILEEEEEIHKDYWSPMTKIQVSSINGSLKLMKPRTCLGGGVPLPLIHHPQSHNDSSISFKPIMPKPKFSTGLFHHFSSPQEEELYNVHKREESQDLAQGSDGEPLLIKRPRIESPMPTFKTDTASVLHDAIDYIKYLHEQLSVKIGEGVNNHQDLRSQGLCLVPLSNTLPIVNGENMDAELWTLTYDGSIMKPQK